MTPVSSRSTSRCPPTSSPLECGYCLFVSSISAYAGFRQPNDEHSPTGVLTDLNTEEITDTSYGPMKALCEQYTTTAFNMRACIVRPGYIVGPLDRSDRFTYWPVRAAKGGRCSPRYSHRVAATSYGREETPGRLEMEKARRFAATKTDPAAHGNPPVAWFGVARASNPLRIRSASGSEPAQPVGGFPLQSMSCEEESGPRFSRQSGSRLFPEDLSREDRRAPSVYSDSLFRLQASHLRLPVRRCRDARERRRKWLRKIPLRAGQCSVCGQRVIFTHPEDQLAVANAEVSRMHLYRIADAGQQSGNRLKLRQLKPAIQRPRRIRLEHGIGGFSRFGEAIPSGRNTPLYGP